ncbi:MAG: hypothetical protein OHK0038_13370 [Flammeovirgaceae bacterium]
MKFTIDKSEKYTILELQEEKLDSLKAPRLKSEFVTLYQSGTQNLILNLSHVKYVDSSGLSAILVAKRMANEAGGHLVLAGVNDHVMKLLKISKLDEVFTILSSIQESIDFIFLNEIEKELDEEEEEKEDDGQ